MLFTFYIQSVLKFKKESGAKGLPGRLSTVCHIRTVPCYRARWLREIGFVGREYKRWYHQKPKCADNSQGFVSVRIQDFYPALVVFAYGVVLSLLILILEIAYSKLQRQCRE